MRLRLFTSILSLAASTAFATPPRPHASDQNGAPPAGSAVDQIAAEMQHNGGSLLRASMSMQPDAGPPRVSSVSLFAVPEPTPKLVRIHDLVTIIIREDSAFSSTGTTDLKRTADIDAKLSQFITLSLKNMSISGNTLGPVPPEIAASAARNFKGEATVDRADTMNARVTARVIDVKPNGTLVLEATKRIKMDEEEQRFVLTGMCDAQQVSPDGTILSTQLADLELTKTHTGAVRDTTKRGWVGKLLDLLNPF